MANASGRDEEKRVERGKSLGPVVRGDRQGEGYQGTIRSEIRFRD